MVNGAHRTMAGDGAAGFAKLPATVIEVESEFVLGARLTGSGKPAVRRLAVKALDRGVVDPSASQLNLAKPDALASALLSVSKSMGAGGGPTALLLPDAAVRVCLLEFETLPSKPKEREALLAWRIKDNLGFSPDEARLSYQEMHRAPGIVELLVLAIKKAVLAEYEKAIERARGSFAFVLPASLALLPLLSQTDATCQLLTHACSGCVTHALVDGERLRFWRTRQLTRADGDSGTAEVVSEASRAAASVRDRFNLKIERAWCCSRPGGGADLIAALEAALGVPVNPLPLGTGVEAGLRPDEKPLFGLFGAPLAGMISNLGRSS